jgi:hypothetical protein
MKYFYLLITNNSKNNTLMKKLITLMIPMLFLFVGVGNAQVTYNGNGNTGFGGAIGNSSLLINDDNTTITFTLTRGTTGDFNDFMVLYIDNGSSGRNVINSDVADGQDSHRKAISHYGSGDINLPTGFNATYAVAINTNYGGLWSIPSSGIISDGSLNHVDEVGNPSSANFTSFDFSFDWSEIGLTGGDNFSFVIHYGNPNDGSGNMYSSNEGYGQGLPGSNPGFNAFSFNTFYQYPTGYEGGLATTKSDGNWSENETWTNGNPPLDGDDVTISNSVTLNQNAIVNDLTVSSDASLTVSVSSDLTVNNDLTIAASKGPKAAGSLTIKSDATGNGSLIVNGTASGSITAERYIAGHGGTVDAGWHLIGSPVDNMAIAGSWIPVSGSDDDLYAWSESDYQWLNYHQGGITNFANGNGYLVAYQSTTTHSFSGIPNTGDVTVELSWTDRTNSAEEGWNLLGNPYPSALIWGTDWDLTNVQATAQVYNSTAKTYDAIYADGIIPANQGFFVQAKTTANGQNFTIPSAKRTHSSTAFYKAGDANRLKLKVYPESASQFRDIFTVDVNDQAEAGFDAFDAYELYGMGDTPQLFAIDDATNNLSVQSIHPQALEDATLLNLGVQAAAGNYVIEVESMLPDEDVSVILEDLETGTFTDLRAVNTYAFTISEGAASERFVLHLGKNATSIETPETLDNEVTIFAGNNRIYVKSHTTLTNAIVSVYNTVGQLVKTTDYYSGEQVLQIRQSGTYIVRVEANEGVSIQKVIVQ